MNDTETPNPSSTACPQRVRERSQLRGLLVLYLYSQVHEARIFTLILKEEGSEVHRSPNQGRADCGGGVLEAQGPHVSTWLLSLVCPPCHVTVPHHTQASHVATM